MESTPHAVVFSSGVASDTLALGQHFDVTLNTAGTYAYHCGIHPDMTGTIIVTA